MLNIKIEQNFVLSEKALTYQSGISTASDVGQSWHFQYFTRLQQSGKKGFIRRENVCENRLKCADVTSDRAQQADGTARKEVGWRNTSTSRIR